MTKLFFNPYLERCGRIYPLDTPQSQTLIIAEPLLYSASLEFAACYGGPLTRAVLRKLPNWDPPNGFHWVVDTRTHMLMPGQYPAIPGWHCDGVPRGNYTAQPDLNQLRDDVWHVVAHVSTHPEGVSNTQFITEPYEIDCDESRVWASVHEHLKRTDVELSGSVLTPGDGAITRFKMPTLHRATPAKHRGWRWWFRASMYYNRPVNQIRNHVQVYTVGDGAGW